MKRKDKMQNNSKAEADVFPRSEKRRQYEQNRRKVRVWLVAVIAIVCFAALSLFWLCIFVPMQAGNAVEASFEDGLSTETVDVSAKCSVSGSAFAILGGEADSMELRLRYDGGSVSEVNAEWPDASGILDKIKAGRGASAECSPENIRIVWDTESFASYVKQNMGVIDNPVVTIKKGEMKISGSLTLQGASRDITVVALPQTEAGGELKFAVSSVSVGGEDISEELAEKINERLSLGVKIPGLDWSIGEGAITIDKNNVIFESK